MKLKLPQIKKQTRKMMVMVLGTFLIAIGLAEGLYTLFKTNSELPISVQAKVFQYGKVLARPHILINEGESAAVSQSTDTSSILLRILAARQEGNEVLVDMDLCMGDSITSKEGSYHCDEMSEKKLLVQFGEVTKLKTRNGEIHLQLSEGVPSNKSPIDRKILNGVPVANR